MRLSPSFLTAIPNSSAVNSVDVDRIVLGSLLGVEAEQYVSQKATAILGGFPKQVDLTINDTVYSIPSTSVGANVGDFSPFAFLGKEIPIELPEIKSALNAIYEACMRYGLKGEELQSIVSQNAECFLQAELKKIESYLAEKGPDMTEGEENILLDYHRRLSVESGKFSAYILSFTVQESKREAEVILSVESPRVSQKKKPLIIQKKNQAPSGNTQSIGAFSTKKVLNNQVYDRAA